MAKPKTKTARRRPPTIHRFEWRQFKLRIKHTPDYLERGWSHVELHLVAPKGAPLPITTTGYLSQFLTEDDLVTAGGPIGLFRAMLDREAKTKAWAKAEFKWRQGDLFDASVRKLDLDTGA